MARLTQAELNDRLRFDYLVVDQMRTPLWAIAAFRSPDDLAVIHNPISDPSEYHLAIHYRIDYHIKTLVGPGKFSDRTQVHIDLLANGNYPYNEPTSWVINSPMPWSAHFKIGAPICTGDFWDTAQGSVLLGQLLVHIARLLNFDEIARGGGYRGYNGPAIDYWKNQLGWQPITRGLAYPGLPTQITHGTTSPSTNRTLFTPRNTQIPNQTATIFRPKSK